jgi:xanthosine utilization system XapX-like protein
MSKGAALVIGLVIILLFGVLAFLLPERIGGLTPVLTAVVTLVGAYIGLQVANNGVRGKFFNPDLYNAENSEGEKKGLT